MARNTAVVQCSSSNGNGGMVVVKRGFFITQLLVCDFSVQTVQNAMYLIIRNLWPCLQCRSRLNSTFVL